MIINFKEAQERIREQEAQKKAAKARTEAMTTGFCPICGALDCLGDCEDVCEGKDCSSCKDHCEGRDIAQMFLDAD